MTTRFVNTDISGPGTPVALFDGNGVWVGRNGLVGSITLEVPENDAIIGQGSNHTAHIEGAVAGYNGISLGNDSTLDSGNSVVIASTGVVYGSNFGVVLFGT